MALYLIKSPLSPEQMASHFGPVVEAAPLIRKVAESVNPPYHYDAIDAKIASALEQLADALEEAGT